MRVVLDTNVVVSGLLWGGAPRRLLDAARARRLELCVSSVLLAELADVLSRRHLAAVIAPHETGPEQLMQGYAMLAELVIPASVAATALRDPDDNDVLACASAARADLIVSGDSDLLVLKEHDGISIVKPAEALARIEAA